MIADGSAPLLYPIQVPTRNYNKPVVAHSGYLKVDGDNPVAPFLFFARHQIAHPQFLTNIDLA